MVNVEEGGVTPSLGAYIHGLPFARGSNEYFLVATGNSGAADFFLAWLGIVSGFINLIRY